MQQKSNTDRYAKRVICEVLYKEIFLSIFCSSSSYIHLILPNGNTIKLIISFLFNIIYLI